jgi:hypothetical protein|tara:strand:+ start:2699 stop:2944 length:246 start_codon:yes stop_codon:yes gene_type:complete
MLLHALKKSFEADVAEHSAVIDIYLQKPVGIGEHDKLLEVVKDRFEKLTCAKHSLEELEKIVNAKTETETETKAEAKTKTK